MKPSRAILVWTVLAVCAVLVIGAMTWLTRGVLAAGQDRERAERERALAENRADLEERTRLALWRMDALGAAIMLRENRYPATLADIAAKPLTLADTLPEVLLHFEVRKGGEPFSPELGTIDTRLTGNAALLAGREERLQRLRELLAANPLPGDEWTLLNNAAAEGQVSWDAVPKDAPKEQNYNTLQRLNKKGDELRKDETYQTYSNASERAQRAKAVAQTVDNAYSQQDKSAALPAPGKQAQAEAVQPFQPDTTDHETADIGQMRAVWVGGELFLLRQVIWNLYSARTRLPLGKSSSVQGVWLDSQKLREQLLHEVADLLPRLKLLPAEGKHAAEDPLAMVSFPFRLERNEVPNGTGVPAKSPFGAPLWVAWAAVALAVATSTLLVRGVMRLSERRASFVSAVTHELRTPLTTFRLYSDMLESGAVKPEKRGDYLRVLSREADRLSHLVENVLSFSKIERGSARSVVRETTVADLLEPMRERLEARLETAGLTLEVDHEPAVAARRVRVDSAAVEHILFNLIDNAAKYAAAGDPPKVLLHVGSTGKNLEIVVTDHGPGIPAAERRRIFRAFHKSAREAAESRPGVGLGLALSRRLAKSLGGALDCVDSEQGARFVLRLPISGEARDQKPESRA